MVLWKPSLTPSTIQLAVEGACGGTSVGVHLSRQVIENGGRVLWASPELPDGTRFSQIFQDLPLTSSSKFHAMNLVGAVDQSFIALRNAAEMLPGVKLVVVDDYCPDTGRIPKDVISAVNKFTKDSEWVTLLISKGGESMDDSPLIARGEKEISSDNTWLLTRPDANSKRQLWVDGEAINLILVEKGFILDD